LCSALASSWCTTRSTTLRLRDHQIYRFFSYRRVGEPRFSFALFARLLAPFPPRLFTGASPRRRRVSAAISIPSNGFLKWLVPPETLYILVFPEELSSLINPLAAVQRNRFSRGDKSYRARGRDTAVSARSRVYRFLLWDVSYSCAMPRRVSFLAERLSARRTNEVAVLASRQINQQDGIWSFASCESRARDKSFRRAEEGLSMRYDNLLSIVDVFLNPLTS